jgi:ABC-type transport system substrate-binding protein
VRKAGDKVRITAQLIDAVHDRHLWSETYDRQLTDIFAIQDEIANAIVTALRGSLTTAKAAPVVKVHADTDNMQAYELYLKARENFIARRELSETAKMFERVVQLDPKFARGWEGLAADPDPYSAWHSSQADTGYNFANWANADADKALEDGRLTTDPAKRKVAYEGFQQVFAAEVPSLILYYPQYHFAVSKRVTGPNADPLDVPSDRFRTITQWQIAAP